MISRLIDLDIKIDETPINERTNNTNFDIKDYAISFINGMNENQRNRFKLMLQNNIQCGMSVAYSYGIDYQKFIAEVKKQLKV